MPAITFDAKTSTSDDAPHNPLTLSHTTANQSNRIMLIGYAGEELDAAAADLVLTAVTYNGVAATKLDHAQDSASGITDRVELWYLLAPATGSNTLSVTCAGDIDGFAITALTYYNVKQVAPTYASNHASASSAVSTTIVPLTGYSMLVDVMINGSAANSVTVDGAQTQRENATSSPDSVLDWGMSEKLVTTAASTTMQWTLGGTSRWGQVVAALQPLPSGGFFMFM